MCLGNRNLPARESWGKGKIAQRVFFDISSAFDRVWHKGIIEKLEQIEISNIALDLFTNYLSNRKQRVVVDGIKSNFLDIEAGVPQGSRLGPLLFIIYINDIVEGLEGEILIFADDCSLVASGLDPNETTQVLNRDLDKILSWAELWKVTFNAAKTKEMVFSNKVLNNSPPLMYNSTLIDKKLRDVLQEREVASFNKL